jgi:Protein of unknown function (DUF4435)
MADRATVTANSVMLKSSAYPGAAFGLVEGSDDKKFYGRFLDDAKCKLVIANGKPAVLAALQILEARGFRAAFGVVDQDYDVIEKVTFSASVILTDAHDLEAMLLSSPALDAVRAELDVDDVLVGLEEAWGHSLGTELGRICRDLGLLRLSARRLGLPAKFDGLDFDRLVAGKKESFVLPGASVLAAVSIRSPGVSMNEVSSLIAQRECQNIDSSVLCNGHDMVRVLAVICRRHGLMSGSVDVAAGRLEQMLRLAAPLSWFQSLSVWRRLGQWQTDNPGFRLLP